MAVDSGLALASGLLNDARDTYLNVRRTAEQNVGLIVGTKSSDKRQEERAHSLPAGHTKYKPYGGARQYQGFDFESWTTVNYEYDGGVEWLAADRKDDRTDSLVDQARNMGRSLALKPVQFLFDAINGTTSWLPHAVTGPDGLSAFTSSTRHEDTGGNILSGQTLTTTAGIETAIFAAEAKIAEYKDGYGEPLLDDDILDSPTVVVYSTANNKPFRAAFNAPIVQGSSAGISNVLVTQVAGKQYVLWETSRLATGVALVCKQGGPRPFYIQEREQIVETMWTEENSKIAADTGYESIGWRQRLGFDMQATYNAVKITA